MKEERLYTRIEVYKKACVKLREALNLENPSVLEKEGTIQRFEYTLELAWKCLKDYIENKGVILEETSPKNVIKKLFGIGILEKADIWIEMIETRNILSHRYDDNTFNTSYQKIKDKYIYEFEKLLDFILEQHD